MTNWQKRVLYYWMSLVVGYIFPFVYFLIRTGVTQQRTVIVFPIILIGILAVFKISADISSWTKSWKPGIGKGLVKSIPKFLLFILLITFGLALKYIIERQLELAFNMYFETVLVVFGSIAVASIIEAVHLKYKELDLIEKGYVLGVVNK